MTEVSHVEVKYIDEQAAVSDSGPVICLGIEFPNDEARHAYFTERLREHLQDPTFRAIEGFPIGKNEAILALSDPPYYTSCPNPFLQQIVEEWQRERRELHVSLGLADSQYHREPFADDVSEGKNDPIYNAHSYHTKVPHKAIMRYILYYTEPGDIVYDGFCGTGMAGVAAQLCGDRHAVEELGYKVDDDGNVYEGKQRIGRVGVRKAIVNDLAPVATFIAYNLNTPADVTEFEDAAQNILKAVKEELGWMYLTWHPHCDDPNRVPGNIHYVIWSDVVACPFCAQEMVYWDVAVVEDQALVRDTFSCTRCGAQLTTRNIERVLESAFEPALDRAVSIAKQEPVRISYSVGNSRYKKNLDAYDRSIVERVRLSAPNDWFPLENIPKLDRYFKDSLHLRNYEYVFQFYERRTLFVLSAIWAGIDQSRCSRRTKALLKASFTATLPRLDRLNRYMPQHNRHVGPLVGTLYVSWLSVEISALNYWEGKLADFGSLQLSSFASSAAITTGSATWMARIPDNTVDYVFTDPPFGHNLMYAELNHRWESWLQVFGSTESEAIVRTCVKISYRNVK